MNSTLGSVVPLAMFLLGAVVSLSYHIYNVSLTDTQGLLKKVLGDVTGNARKHLLYFRSLISSIEFIAVPQKYILFVN